MWEKDDLNTGIIFTNASCIGCNRCIAGCIAVGANVVVNRPDSDKHMVLVDSEKCILCGKCVESCIHGARTYKDDTEEFFEALQNGEEISLIVSATFLTNYEKQYHNVLGYLKHLGVKCVYNTGLGGDIMVWAYMNLIKEFGLSGVISQRCPVIVNYLEKYKPELLDNLVPVQTPLMCTAIYVSDYLKNTDKLAYLSPCIAEKQEIEDVNTYGKVSYSVTFERLMEHMKDIDLSGYYAKDEVSYGLGALIPMSGGLSENIKHYIGFNEVLIQTEGPSNIFPYFDYYNQEVSTQGRLPFLVDALSCTNGCNFGTGTTCGVELRNDMTFSAHRVKENAYTLGKVAKGRNYQERLAMLNEQFAEFELSSFVRQYDRTRALENTILEEDVMEELYLSMYKYTEEQRNTDCGSCGYPSCKAMAYAIGTHRNNKENCINYSKECIRLETEKINNLLEEISTMNEELKKSTQLKSNFLANMSHEIRTPMNAIIGMAEMALRGQLEAEERGYLQQIKSSGRTLLAIINDILDFSKIESGKMEINETEYQVMSIINDTTNMVLTRIGEKNVDLMIEVDPNIPRTLYGDDIRIKQVLVNLVNNAIKFTESGYVKIILRHEREEQGIRLTISVEDSGLGIKKADLKKLFNSFQQVDSKRNRNVEGTGLGLVIAREFVLLMEGQVSVESDYGKGSTFSFVIPQRIITDMPSIVLKKKETIKIACYIKNEHTKDSMMEAIKHFPQVENTFCQSPHELAEAQKNGAEFAFVDYLCWNKSVKSIARKNRKMQMVVLVDPRKETISAPNVRKLNLPIYSLNVAATLNNEEIEMYTHDIDEKEVRFEAPEANILIVDDNAINLTVALGLLSPFRMNITTAVGGRESVDLVKKNQYDIVFMDHMMPEIDGVEATHLIRELEGDYFKNLPIIALTANAINNAKDMFVSEGMNDFVAKPIDMLDLTLKLRKWLPAEKIKNVMNLEQPKVEDCDRNLEIKGLDVQAALEFSGSVELFMLILKDYYKVIEKKVQNIRKYEEEKDIAAYIIEVHALKSSSKLVGALELSKMAERLEKCGNENDVEAIEAETEKLLTLYESYIEILKPYCEDNREEALKKQVEAEQIEAWLDCIYNALEEFDIDSASAALTSLTTAILDERQELFRKRLQTAIEVMEYDEGAELIMEWREAIKETAEK